MDYACYSLNKLYSGGYGALAWQSGNSLRAIVCPAKGECYVEIKVNGVWCFFGTEYASSIIIEVEQQLAKDD